jgi:hypothetical protein
VPEYITVVNIRMSNNDAFLVLQFQDRLPLISSFERADKLAGDQVGDRNDTYQKLEALQAKASGSGASVPIHIN